MGQLGKKWISLLLTTIMLAGVPLAVNAEAPPEQALVDSQEAEGSPEDTGETTEEGTGEDTEEDAGENTEEEDSTDGAAETGTPTDLPEQEQETEAFADYNVDAASTETYKTDIFDSLGLTTLPSSPNSTRAQNAPYGDSFTLTINELYMSGYTYGVNNYQTMLIGHESHHQGTLDSQFPLR